MTQTSVLWIGDHRRREFAAAWSLLAAHTAVREAGDLPTACRLLADDEHHVEPGDEAAAPELIVVAQAYPGQFTVEEIESLQRVAPLARVVALLGSWCEGEARSGQPWPAAKRVYWHQWQERFSQELARIEAGRMPLWSLPVTATEDERLLAAADRPLTVGQGTVVILARSADVGEMLFDVCRRHGYSPVIVAGAVNLAQMQGVSAAIWEGPECDRSAAAEIAALKTAVAPAPVVAVLSFPRSDDVQRAALAGAGLVLSKPIRLDELLAALARGPAGRRAASLDR